MKTLDCLYLWICTPSCNVTDFNIEKRIYNDQLRRGRRTIENAFGILASQWRIYRNGIIANVENATAMIQATIVLHNFLRQNINENDDYVTEDLLERDGPEGVIDGSWKEMFEQGCAFRDITRFGANNSTQQAVKDRDEFCRYFNKEGAVTWQFSRIYV